MTVSTVTLPTDGGAVIAGLPLALLEAVHEQDRPGEVLEDENFALALPRRLGLTSVVLSQIERYEQAHAAGRKVPVTDLTNLLQLVLRRPDAEAILRDAGRRVARFHFARLPRLWATLLRVLPSSLTIGILRRAAQGLMRGIAGSGQPLVNGKPLVVHLHGSLAAKMSPLACVLYTGALEELVVLSSGKQRAVMHSRCVGRRDEVCEWTTGD